MENLKDYFKQAFAPIHLRLTDLQQTENQISDDDSTPPQQLTNQSIISISSHSPSLSPPPPHNPNQPPSSPSFEVITTNIHPKNTSPQLPSLTLFTPQNVLLPLHQNSPFPQFFLTPRRQTPNLTSQPISKSLLPLLQLTLQKLRIKELRPSQQQALARIFALKSTLCSIPTSGGKSLIYALPAVLFRKISLVVTPTIALREDQIRSLQELGVNARQLNSGPFQICAGELTHQTELVLFLTPEKLETVKRSLQELVQNNQIVVIAVDECHLMVEWKGFRQEYGELSKSIKEIRGMSKVPVVALSGSLRENDVYSINKKFSFCGMEILQFSVFRPNLHIQVKYQTGNKLDHCVKFMANFNEKTLIYARKTATTEELADLLTKHRIPSLPFHSKLKSALENAKNWTEKPQVIALVATVAFGMGIDIKTLSQVLIHDFPSSVNDFIQKIGRGGRSGQRSDSFIFFDYLEAFAFIKIIYGNEDIKPVCELFVLLCRPVCKWRLLEIYYSGFECADCGKCAICCDRGLRVQGVDVKGVCEEIINYMRGHTVPQFRGIFKDKKFIEGVSAVFRDYEKMCFLLFCELITIDCIVVDRYSLKFDEEKIIRKYYVDSRELK